MAQITNVQLMDAANRLEKRVEKLEERMKANDGALDAMSKKLEEICHHLSVARLAVGIVGAVIGPIVTGLIVLLIQHFFVR